jgi:hypothetical protein
MMIEGPEWDEWLGRPPPDPPDQGAEAWASDQLTLLEQDLTREQLTRILVGELWIDLLVRMVRDDEAEAEAAELRRQHSLSAKVSIERLPGELWARRSRLVVSARRPNLFQLCKDDRLNRRKLISRLENAGRSANPKGGLATLLPWRHYFRCCLMNGRPPAEPAEAAGTLSNNAASCGVPAEAPKRLSLAETLGMLR